MSWKEAWHFSGQFFPIGVLSLGRSCEHRIVEQHVAVNRIIRLFGKMSNWCKGKFCFIQYEFDNAPKKIRWWEIGLVIARILSDFSWFKCLIIQILFIWFIFIFNEKVLRWRNTQLSFTTIMYHILEFESHFRSSCSVISISSEKKTNNDILYKQRLNRSWWIVNSQASMWTMFLFILLDFKTHED